MRTKDRWLAAAAIAGLVAGAGDFIVTLVLGLFYPGFNHIRMVMSELGAPGSPVARWIGIWWVVFGVLFVVFALGLARAFGTETRSVVVGATLIGVFGLGAGIGAGLFPMDAVGAEPTLAGQLHDILAGLGFTAIAFLALVSMAIFPRKEAPAKFWLSIVVFVLGLAFFGLFIAAEDAATGGLLAYAGLWQRLFLLDQYALIAVLAVTMLRMSRNARRGAGSQRDPSPGRRG